MKKSESKLRFEEYAENYEAVQRIFKSNNFFPNWGAEIGVRRGDFSEYILRNNPNLSLYCVDSYLPYKDIDHTYTEKEQRVIKEEADFKLKNYKVSFIYLPSVEAASFLFKERPLLDFVFIDAEHTYPQVKADIEAWVPFIITGGLLMGHDFSMPPVNKAVTEWAKAHDYYKDILDTGKEGNVWAIKI